jgi:hypothetical protein
MFKNAFLLGKNLLTTFGDDALRSTGQVTKTFLGKQVKDDIVQNVVDGAVALYAVKQGIEGVNNYKQAKANEFSNVRMSSVEESYIEGNLNLLSAALIGGSVALSRGNRTLSSKIGNLNKAKPTQALGETLTGLTRGAGITTGLASDGFKGLLESESKPDHWLNNLVFMGNKVKGGNTLNSYHFNQIVPLGFLGNQTLQQYLYNKDLEAGRLDNGVLSNQANTVLTHLVTKPYMPYSQFIGEHGSNPSEVSPFQRNPGGHINASS